MQEQFNFSTNTPIDPQENVLAMQVTAQHFRYCIYNPADKKLLQLKHFSFKQISSGELDNIVEKNPVLHRSFDKICCGLDFGFSTLLPSETGHVDATPLMYLENADQQDHVISETIPGLEITNIYAVPPVILTWMVQHFPSSAYLHHHTAGIKMVNEFTETGLLRVDIQPNRFTVIAFKAAQLLLARSYSYAVPADVAFYLLKIGEQFQFSQEKVFVQLSGLVNTGSKLYRELYDYFLNISLKAADWTDEITGLPAHYFTSLNELTLCELLQEV